MRDHTTGEAGSRVSASDAGHRRGLGSAGAMRALGALALVASLGCAPPEPRSVGASQPRTWRRVRRAGAMRALGALTLVASLGCAPPEPRSVGASQPRTWRYSVEASPGASELSVQMHLPAGVPEQLGVDRYAHPFLDGLELQTADGYRPVPRAGQRWQVPRCKQEGCTLRYHYHLGEAAARIDRFAYAGYRSGALLAPPSTFLLAPQDYEGDDEYRVEMRTAPGEHFVTGIWRNASGEPSAPARVLFEAPYSGFGRFERQRLDIGSGAIELAIAPGDSKLRVSHHGLRRAVLAAATAVAAHYGHFPVPAVTLIVLPRSGDEIAGMQLGNGGASIVLFLGADVDDAQLAADWVLVHELLHLGFPTLDRRYLWLAEGLATYQEPLVRARAGSLSEVDVWRGYVEGLPKGLPSDIDTGLDGTDRWGRTYWGGALVFLGLDLELRTRSAGRVSLDTALRAILRAGGNTAVRWSLARTLATGDAALTSLPPSDPARRRATRPGGASDAAGPAATGASGADGGVVASGVSGAGGSIATRDRAWGDGGGGVVATDNASGAGGSIATRDGASSGGGGGVPATDDGLGAGASAVIRDGAWGAAAGVTATDDASGGGGSVATRAVASTGEARAASAGTSSPASGAARQGSRGATSDGAAAALEDTSLMAAYARFANTPVQVDLAALYRRLGVRVDGGRVTLDDAAELAALRRSLVQPGP